MGTTHRMAIRPALVVGLAALGLAGCGGSGGGGGPGARPEGSYHVVSLRRDVAGDKVRSLTGVWDADGEGTMHGVVAWERDGGALIGPSVPADFAFTVDATRAIHMTSGSFPTLDGRVTGDGFLSVLASEEAGADPALLVMTRRRTSVTLADIVGEWWWVQWRHQPTNLTTDGFASFAEAQVAANGTLLFQDYTYNDDGEIDPLPVLFALSSFSFSPDGTIAYDDGGGGLALRGGLSEDGNLMLLAPGEGIGTANAQIVVLVRRGQAQAVSDLAGDLAVFGFQSVGAQFADTFGTGSIPDYSGGNWTLAANRDGALIAPAIRPVEAFAWVSGQVRLDVGATNLYLGGVGRQGDYGVVAGGFEDGNPPAAYLWVR